MCEPKFGGIEKMLKEALLKLLSPFAPHMVEEMWELMGYAQKYGKMCMQMPWPDYDESKTIDATAEMAVQVNGKLKGTVTGVKTGAVNSEIIVKLAGGEELTAVITNESAENLKLAAGKPVTAIVKASHMILGVAE